MDKAQYRKLMDWMKNDCHLQNWWEEEFAKSDAGYPYEYSEMGCHDLSARLPRFLHLLLDRHVANTRNAFRCEGR